MNKNRFKARIKIGTPQNIQTHLCCHFGEPFILVKSQPLSLLDTYNYLLCWFSALNLPVNLTLHFCMCLLWCLAFLFFSCMTEDLKNFTYPVSSHREQSGKVYMFNQNQEANCGRRRSEALGKRAVNTREMERIKIRGLLRRIPWSRDDGILERNQTRLQ